MNKINHNDIFFYFCEFKYVEIFEHKNNVSTNFFFKA